MLCDVRKCPKNEALPLYNKFAKGQQPTDVSWEDKTARIRFGEMHSPPCLIYLFTPYELAYFEFYPGVDNIRFDGLLADREALEELKQMTEYGRGTRVSDFVDLGTDNAKEG